MQRSVNCCLTVYGMLVLRWRLFNRLPSPAYGVHTRFPGTAMLI